MLGFSLASLWLRRGLVLGHLASLPVFLKRSERSASCPATIHVASARCPPASTSTCASSHSDVQASWGPWRPCHQKPQVPVVTLPVCRGRLWLPVCSQGCLPGPLWLRHGPWKGLLDAGCPHTVPGSSVGIGRGGGRAKGLELLGWLGADPDLGLPLPQRIPAVTIQK